MFVQVTSNGFEHVENNKSLTDSQHGQDKKQKT